MVLHELDPNRCDLEGQRLEMTCLPLGAIFKQSQLLLEGLIKSEVSKLSRAVCRESASWPLAVYLVNGLAVKYKGALGAQGEMRDFAS